MESRQLLDKVRKALQDKDGMVKMPKMLIPSGSHSLGSLRDYKVSDQRTIVVKVKEMSRPSMKGRRPSLSDMAKIRYKGSCGVIAYQGRSASAIASMVVAESSKVVLGNPGINLIHISSKPEQIRTLGDMIAANAVMTVRNVLSNGDGSGEGPVLDSIRQSTVKFSVNPVGEVAGPVTVETSKPNKNSLNIEHSEVIREKNGVTYITIHGLTINVIATTMYQVNVDNGTVNNIIKDNITDITELAVKKSSESEKDSKSEKNSDSKKKTDDDTPDEEL